MIEEFSSHLFIFQGLHYSTGTLAIMCDTTSRALDKMSDWPYHDKYEMKYLGSTIFGMEDKFVELMILGISKMVEDLLNDLDRFAGVKVGIYDSSIESISYCDEVRIIRHLCNVIKHDNSIIDTSQNGRSSRKLVESYGFPDDTPIKHLNLLEKPRHGSLLKQLFYAQLFCLELLNDNTLIKAAKPNISEDRIVDYMIDKYVHSIPGHPNANSDD